MEIRELKRYENGSVAFEMHVSGGEWKDILTASSAELQKNRAVPGYRAGKASLPVAAQHFGMALYDSAVNRAKNELFPKLCGEYDFAPVSTPKFTVAQADLSELFMLVSFVDYPKLETPSYKGLQVEKPVKTVTEADIDAAVEHYMDIHRYVHEVAREARIGDIVEVGFTGTSGGKSFPYDRSEKSRFTLGDDHLFTGLDEALLGHVAGERLELTLTMADDFHRENIRGMTLDLTVDLHGVWERTLLECTDEYVRENVKDCNSLAEFRELIRTELQKQNDAESDILFEKNLVNALAEKVSVPIPEVMIASALEGYVSTLTSLAARQGKAAYELLSDEGKTMKDFMDECRPTAVTQVKQSVALDYIIKAEGLDISADELAAYIRGSAAAAKISAEEAAHRMGGAENIYEKLLNERAMKIVRENAVPIEKEVESFSAYQTEGKI